MRFIPSTTLVVVAGVFFSAAVNAACVPLNRETFFLKIQTTSTRSITNELFTFLGAENTLLEKVCRAGILEKVLSLGDKGDTNTAPGVGALHTSIGIGFLLRVLEPRLPPGLPHYNLTFGDSVPSVAGVLSQNFKISGGKTLGYDFGSGDTGKWYLIRREGLWVPTIMIVPERQGWIPINDEFVEVTLEVEFVW